MTFKHREAIGGGRRLRLGIAGPSRSGKTYSALRVATGMGAGLNGKIFVIDTDNEFSLDYADDFKFEIVDFQPPFTPERYLEAVQYCVEKGAAVIVVDHMTHEHTGQGGIIERQQAVEEELAKKWKTSRDKAKAAAWNEAKTIPHGKFVSYITRVKQPMIFNFRAKDKIKIVKDAQGKQEWIHMGYTPICTEQFDFEMTAMLILPPNSDGYPDKDLSEIRKPLRGIMHLDDQIDESLGRRLAAWAAGATVSAPRERPEPAKAGTVSPPSPSSPSDADPQPELTELITAEQVKELEALCAKSDVAVDRVLAVGQVASLGEITQAEFAGAVTWVKKRAGKPPAAIEDEAVALLRIDKSKDEGEASAVLELCANQPFYPRVVAAFKNRFQTGVA